MRAGASYGNSAIPPLASALPATTATALKRQGWPSVMMEVRREGHLLVTNHNLPEAVILPPEEYDRLVLAAQNAREMPDPVVDALVQKFNERLKCLQEPDADEKLANAMLKSLALDAKLIAGDAY